MRIIRDLFACPEDAKDTVLALGNFDGMHLGHQAIIRDCVTLARGEGRKAAAMTFEPHPRQFFATLNLRSGRNENAISVSSSGAAQAAALNGPDPRSARPHTEPLRVYPLKKKIELMRDLGVDILFLARFNQKLASTSAESFIDDILYKTLGVAHVVTGYNFAFGKGRTGTTELLAAEGKKLGFGYTAMPQVRDGGKVISSSAIREALARGDMLLASAMLGRPYRIEGIVRHGHSLGKSLGYPTANLSLKTLFKPRFGIYAARVTIDGKSYDAAANVGFAPTLPHQEPLLEAHLFDRQEALYGKRIAVELRDYVREEEKFADMDALKTQIAADCAQIKHLLAEGA